jgi:hypothetical protein
MNRPYSAKKSTVVWFTVVASKSGVVRTAIEIIFSSFSQLIEFGSLPGPPGPGSLVQSTDNPMLFYSFGPWPSAEAVAAMRANPDTSVAIGGFSALCDKAAPGMFSLVATVGD